MREILFRGKRCDNDEWAQGYYIRADHHWHTHGIHKDWLICGASSNGGWFALHNKYAVKAETVGQFTGLTDKNGKKIFEGDIIKQKDITHQGEIQIEGEKYLVMSSSGCWFGICKKPDYKRAIFLSELCNIGEVIGNIHDNKSLMNNQEAGE